MEVGVTNSNVTFIKSEYKVSIKREENTPYYQKSLIFEYISLYASAKVPIRKKKLLLKHDQLIVLTFPA